MSFTPDIGPGEILPHAAAKYPDKVALVIGDVRLTYRELEDRSRNLAAALQRNGIGEGSVVSLYGQNSWEWIVGYHGALRAGAVVNPVNVMLTGPELAYVLKDCQANALLVGAAQAPIASGVIADVPTLKLFATFGTGDGATSFSTLLRDGQNDNVADVAPRPEGLCSIGYTSGTTGHPKGAMQSHQAVLLNCALTATMHGRSSDDVIVTALPAAHVYGNVAINGTFLVGGTVVLMERFNAAEALTLIASERATMFEGVPAMYSMILADDSVDAADLSSLRISTIGGQTFARELGERWQKRAGVPLIELWGMTEVAGLGTTHSIHAPAVPGSIGVPLPGLGVRIAPLDGGSGEVATGDPGELLIRGPVVMLGYYGNPDATAEVLGADGWLRTGDVAYADETGHLFVVDRIKDMIVTAGYNVYPAEIERVVAGHPDVAMVAVGRRADETRGEVAVAYVVAKGLAAPTGEDILEYCRSRLAAYKRPRDVVFVNTLPTTSSGKLMRRKLAELDVQPVNAPAG
jgi:long-chain acyl-CoA synthetase